MVDSANANSSCPDSDRNKGSLDYLARAREADDDGDFLLSMYLYLAAFQKSSKEGATPTDDAIFGLKQAWSLALANKERSLAEYIFELIEPYLTADETATYANQLQSLAFDKLEEFGLSRRDLEDIANSIAEDFADGVMPFMHIEQVVKPQNASAEEAVEAESDVEIEGVAVIEAPAEGSPFEEGEGAEGAEPLNYDTLVGYNSVVEIMHDFGIGMEDDPRFNTLIDVLNARHGLKSKPAMDSLLIRSHAREDANHFMQATLGEIDAPAISMRMEDNFQGMPVLCISTQAADFTPSHSLKDVFANGGVLVLEDLDLWDSPIAEEGNDNNPFIMMQLTRGAREAVGLVRAAVENPDVYVLATASLDGVIDDFFLEMLEPLSLIDIDYPDEEERAYIWMDIAKRHPSLRSVNRKDLVRYSANLARYDIYAATREAIEEAYKIGMVMRRYQPVTRENIFDKLAAYHPLESVEYSELEDEVVKDFQSDLDHIDDILEG